MASQDPSPISLTYVLTGFRDELKELKKELNRLADSHAESKLEIARIIQRIEEIEREWQQLQEGKRATGLMIKGIAAEWAARALWAAMAFALGLMARQIGLF